MVEAEEVTVHRSPHMRCLVSPASIEKPNAPISKSHIELVVENVPDDSLVQLEPQNVETHENELVKEILQENQEIF